MKDYASMSDFEINSAVHNALLDKPYELTFHGGGKITWKDKDSGRVIETGIVGYTKNGLHDYCNNPADAWPIIIGQKLSLINADDEWLCVPDYATVDGVAGEDIQKIYFSYGYVDANPLRAAMVVFLMMKESE